MVLLDPKEVIFSVSDIAHDLVVHHVIDTSATSLVGLVYLLSLRWKYHPSQGAQAVKATETLMLLFFLSHQSTVIL